MDTMDIKLGDIVRLKSDPPFEGVVCNIGDYYLIPKRPGDIFTIKIKSLKGSYCIKTVLNLEYESNTDLEKIGFFGLVKSEPEVVPVQLTKNAIIVSRKLLPKTNYSGKGIKIYIKTKKNWFTLLRTTDKMAFYIDGPNECRCGFNTITEINVNVG
jgi:hypothetical protein